MRRIWQQRRDLFLRAAASEQHARTVLRQARKPLAEAAQKKIGTISSDGEMGGMWRAVFEDKHTRLPASA